MAVTANASSLKLISVCLFLVIAKEFSTWRCISFMGKTSFVFWQNTWEKLDSSFYEIETDVTMWTN